MFFLRAARAATISLSVFACGAAAIAAELEVRIGGVASDAGEVGCTLYAGPAGFPMDPATARSVWLPARASGVVCRFADVPPGDYAVAVSHDLNGNKKTDTNILGIPTEAWGVSNNVRPGLRAPRFDEARFAVCDCAALAIDVAVAR